MQIILAKDQSSVTKYKHLLPLLQDQIEPRGVWHSYVALDGTKGPLRPPVYQDGLHAFRHLSTQYLRQCMQPEQRKLLGGIRTKLVETLNKAYFGHIKQLYFLITPDQQQQFSRLAVRLLLIDQLKVYLVDSEAYNTHKSLVVLDLRLYPLTTVRKLLRWKKQYSPAFDGMIRFDRVDQLIHNPQAPRSTVDQFPLVASSDSTNQYLVPKLSTNSSEPDTEEAPDKDLSVEEWSAGPVYTGFYTWKRLLTKSQQLKVTKQAVLEFDTASNDYRRYLYYLLDLKRVQQLQQQLEDDNDSISSYAQDQLDDPETFKYTLYLDTKLTDQLYEYLQTNGASFKQFNYRSNSYSKAKTYSFDEGTESPEYETFCYVNGVAERRIVRLIDADCLFQNFMFYLAKLVLEN